MGKAVEERLQKAFKRKCIRHRGWKIRLKPVLEHNLRDSFKGRGEREVSDTNQKTGWKPAENQDPEEVSWQMKTRAPHLSVPSPWTSFSSSFVVFSFTPYSTSSCGVFHPLPSSIYHLIPPYSCHSILFSSAFCTSEGAEEHVKMGWEKGRSSSYHGGEDVLVKRRRHPQLRCLQDKGKQKWKKNNRRKERKGPAGVLLKDKETVKGWRWERGGAGEEGSIWWSRLYIIGQTLRHLAKGSKALTESLLYAPGLPVTAFTVAPLAARIGKKKQGMLR